MSFEDRLVSLAKKLKPSISDIRNYNAALNSVSKCLDGNKNILKVEIWKCGSIGKGTGIKGQSDLDAVVLLSPKQDMEKILERFQTTLKGCSTTQSIIRKRSVNITVRGVHMDVLPTKYGLTDDLGRAQRSMKEVAEIAGYGDLFKGSARILKYWRDLPENSPNTGNIPSFAIELILVRCFKSNEPETFTDSLKLFFEYIKDSELKDNLQLFDSRNRSLVSYNFSFPKKEFLLSESKNAYKKIKTNPIDETFIFK